MTETAKQADIVLPAASAYEKNGTVTNVCGEVQRLKQAIKVMGTKTDLEIFGQIAKEMGLNLGIWLPDKVFDEIRKSVHGYGVSPALLGDGPGSDYASQRPRRRAARRDSIFRRYAVYLRLAHALFRNTQHRDGSSWQTVRRAGAIGEMNFLILSIIKAAVVAFVLLTALAYLQWLERKVLAHIQLRVGPRRVGPHGLLQPLADVIKLITKEDMMPSHVNKVFWFMAPFIAVLFALIPIAVIPFGTELSSPRSIWPADIPAITTAMQLTDLNIGVLFILGISGLGVYGVALAGWSSNNKYSLLGGLRSSAQMISYELPMALAIAAPLLVLNTLSFRGMSMAKPASTSASSPSGPSSRYSPTSSASSCSSLRPSPKPIACPSIFQKRKTNWWPVSTPNRQHEVRRFLHGRVLQHGDGFLRCDAAVSGWMASALPRRIRFEFPAVARDGRRRRSVLPARDKPARPFDRITLPVVGVAFFGLGRPLLIPAVALPLMPIIWFSAKALFILFVYIWVRGTLPRFRYDQLMRFAWTFMFPVAVTNLFLTGLVVALS